MILKNTIKNIENRTSKICVMGLGYVGLPLVNAFCTAGFNVNGFDISKEKLTLIHPTDHDFYSACRNKLGWSVE